MLFSAQHIRYRDTAKFSKIVLDYIEEAAPLRPFYTAAPTAAGIKQALEAKQNQPIDRAVLVQVLKEQYNNITESPEVAKNIEALLSPATFTICTAHQPNLFTGPLYFIYKILHTIRLAEDFTKQFPAYRFVPVYYMGSEDADKDELNHTYIHGKKYSWQTAQTGAVGRMLIDKDVVQLLNEMAGQLNVLPFGQEIVQLLQNCYTVGKTVQAATFEIVHALFKKFGLVVLIPDHGVLKKLMRAVFEDDLFRELPSQIVEKTCAKLGQQYNVQAQPRAINLFYLEAGIRNRIVKEDRHFSVHETSIRFTEAELRAELENHPERFSPNVILRGLFQETILPNIAFVGGGGELAYWLQLQDLFAHYKVPFPVLVLRNSFLIVEKEWQERLRKWNISTELSFAPALQIINAVLEKEGKLPQLNGELTQLKAVYEDLKKLAAGVDVTLDKHVEALKVRAVQQLQNLEKKMMRAERKKHESLQRQVHHFKETLFPNNGLQERAENISVFYAKWGSGFIDELLQHSLSLEQQFTVLTEA